MNLLWVALAQAVIAATLAAGAAESAPARPLVIGIDHTPVVVADLAKARADFSAMGFAIKPGRFHADGIRNAHVKFVDGTEIELITAPAVTDALTAEYRGRLARGDGPVYFGLYAPDRSALDARLKAISWPARDSGGALGYPRESPLHPLFFGGRNKSPTDRPAYFAHANTAIRLAGLWVRGDPALHALLAGAGVPLRPIRSCGAIPGETEVGTFPEGTLYLVRSASSNVLGAEVEVSSLAKLGEALKKSHLPVQKFRDCAPRALWLSPATAHGIWLEFVEAGKHG